MSIPSAPGTYALILQAEREQAIRVGKSGSLTIRPGWYVYIGSAFGPGGLSARINRHVKKRKKFRWHIDYLRARVTLIDVWYTTSARKMECRWAGLFGQLKGAEIITGFGASDCKCRSHLFRFPDQPVFRLFSEQIHIPVHHALMLR